jgi:gliding motility-associated-like protein
MIRLSTTIFLLLLFLTASNTAIACDGTDVGVIARDVQCNGDADGVITVRSTFSSQNLPYLYSINGGSFSSDSVFGNLDVGIYNITIRNALGCDTTLNETYTISQPAALDVAAISEDVICGGDGRAYPVVTGGIPPYLYQWSLGGGVNIDTLRNLPAGTYTLLVEDQNGCSDIASVDVAGPPDFQILIAPSDPTVAFGETIELSVLVNRSGGSYSYQWFPADGLSCDNCNNPTGTFFADTELRLFVIDTDNGCRDSDTISVKVDGKPSLYVPNAFSPNRDGRNDVFTLYGVGIKAFSLKVYDTRGFILYDGNESAEGWDGLVEGKPALEGLYYFLADVTFVDETRDRKKGQLTLIR